MQVAPALKGSNSRAALCRKHTCHSLPMDGRAPLQVEELRNHPTKQGEREQSLWRRWSDQRSHTTGRVSQATRSVSSAFTGHSYTTSPMTSLKSGSSDKGVFACLLLPQCCTISGLHLHRLLLASQMEHIRGFRHLQVRSSGCRHH